MAKRLRHGDEAPSQPLGEGRQLSLPLDWTLTDRNHHRILDATMPSREIEHPCPGCGNALQKWRGCWACDTCGYSSCGEAE
jgi:hypothetical protein